jgi:hypothetical protein
MISTSALPPAEEQRAIDGAGTRHAGRAAHRPRAAWLEPLNFCSDCPWEK